MDMADEAHTRSHAGGVLWQALSAHALPNFQDSSEYNPY